MDRFIFLVDNSSYKRKDLRSLLFVTLSLGVILVAWVVLNALLAWYPAHPQRLYRDNMKLTMTPSEYGLEYEDVTLGNGLSGWFIPADAAHATVIFVHGWASCREERWIPFLELAQPLQNHQMNVVLYDARYVNSSAAYSGGVRESIDLLEVVHWAAIRTKVPVVIWGFSAGGHAALLALANHDTDVCCALTDSAFVDANEMFKGMYHQMYNIPRFALALLPLFWKVFTGFFPGRIDRPITTPLLVIHGDADSSISVENGRILERFSNVRYWEATGVGHEEAFRNSPSEYLERCINFIQSYIEKRT